MYVKTANVMLDQFELFYFAFAFVFTYATGMPDMPAFMHRPRPRRERQAPRIEVPQWVRFMSRRVETSMHRDWNVGLVSWNYVFRFEVNLSCAVYAYAR